MTLPVDHSGYELTAHTRSVTSSNASRLIDIHVEPRQQSDTLAPGVRAWLVTVLVTCRHPVTSAGEASC